MCGHENTAAVKQYIARGSPKPKLRCTSAYMLHIDGIAASKDHLTGTQAAFIELDQVSILQVCD